MHRLALKNGILNGGTVDVGIRRWSVLNRGSVQRSFSSTGGPSDFSGGVGSDDDRGQRQRKGPENGAREGDKHAKARGRGQGAFSHFLRLHERSIDKHAGVGTSDRDGERVPEAGVSGQFDDPHEEGATEEKNARFERMPPRGRDLRHANISGAESGKQGGEESRSEDSWVEKWFAQVEDEGDPTEADWEDVDDEDSEGEEDDEDEEGEEDEEHTEKKVEEYGPDTWWARSEQEWEEYQKLVTRIQREEEEQKTALQAKWDEMQLKAEETGDTSKLELPDLVFTTEITYEAPPGKATVDRAKPLPRSLETIVGSMELPDGLDVTPNDPEYKEVVNMWKAVSRNNTLDERTKETMMKQIAGFIAKHRNSDAFAKALGTEEFERTK